ncbi:MAG: polysaccharide deacetylase family protein [Akkermansia sp.]|nr:polysaccharide deacetylase family protein [Akkermansia sp.]
MNPISRLQIFSRFIFRNHIYSVKTNRKAVAFTFDDGPSPLTTRKLVDLFAAHNGHATFFFQGNHAEEYSTEVIYAHEHGCDVANHSYDHPSYIKVGAAETMRQIRKANNILKKYIGKRPAFLRPPYNHISQLETFLIWCTTGQKIINCNIAPTDWCGLDSDKLADFLISNMKPGAIICLHDASPSTVEALERVLPTLKQQGYDFLSLSSLFKVGTPSPLRFHTINHLSS